MTHTLLDPCGRFLPALMVHDLKDRLGGRHRRANARWGRVRRPEAPGRLLWIVAGDTRPSVRLGVELTLALVASRLDAAALFTYEAEYPDLVATLARTPRTRCDFGPADYIGAVQAMRRRLLPLGIVVAGMAPRPNLRSLCEASRHALLVAPPVTVDARFERIYPRYAAPHAGQRCAPVADLEVLLHPARDAGAPPAPAKRLWWWHGSDVACAKRLAALFRGHLPQHRLGIAGPAAAALERAGGFVTPWREAVDRPFDPATPIVADTPDWLGYGAASSLGVHFAVDDADALWQAAANGLALSAASAATIANPALAGAVARVDDENRLVTAWAQMATQPALHAAAARVSKRAHATEWQRAAANAADLIARVQRWQ